VGYAFEDTGGPIPVAHDVPDPLAEALAALRSMTSPAQTVGAELSRGPVLPDPTLQPSLTAQLQPVVGMSVPLSHEGLTGTPPGEGPGAQARPDFAVGIDRIGADRSEPQVVEAPPPDPYAPGSFNATTVAGANQAVEDQTARAARAKESAELAKLAAQGDHLTRVADAQEEAAIEVGLLGSSHERAQAKINAAADAETAGWLTRLTNLAKEEPNPGRWWENQSGLGKALWALSLVFGAGHAALTPGARNAALDMVRQEMANDMRQQEARLKREMAVEELKGGLMKERHTRNRSDNESRYGRELARWQALERAWVARAAVPGDMDAQAAKQMSIAFFEEQKTANVMSHREDLVRAKAQEAAQRHAAGLQSARQRFESREAQLQRDWTSQENRLKEQADLFKAVATSPVSVSAGTGAGSKRNPIDPKTNQPTYTELQSGVGTGVILKDRSGKPAGGDGVMMFKDDKTRQAAGEAIEAANYRYTTMKKLRDALEEEGAMTEVAGVGVTNPHVEGLVKEVGYAIAQAQNKVVTDKDFSAGVAQAIGFDPDGNWLQRGKFALTLDEVKAKIDEDLRDMPEHVSSKLRSFNDGAINGQGTEIVWSPDYLKAPEVQERSQREVEGQGFKTGDVPPVKDTADYQARKAKQAADPARTDLPPHIEEDVAALISAAQGSAPKRVEAEAKRILTQLERREAALEEGIKQGTMDARQGTEELMRISETKGILTSVQKAEVARAAQVVKKFENWVKGTPYLSAETARDQAKKRFGITKSPAEVDEIVRRIKKAQGHRIP
jgi:hypothetical protein